MSSDQSQTASESTVEPVAKTAPTQSAEQPATENRTKVNAPMPGTILKVNVTPGQTISQGDTLVILEAMKMENEVVAPVDGVVDEILVQANDRVESDQLLLTI